MDDISAFRDEDVLSHGLLKEVSAGTSPAGNQDIVSSLRCIAAICSFSS